MAPAAAPLSTVHRLRALAVCMCTTLWTRAVDKWPPDGRPVVFLADHPTTGGYPVVGVVPEEALAAAAQAVPGLPVRFVLLRR